MRDAFVAYSKLINLLTLNGNPELIWKSKTRGGHRRSLLEFAYSLASTIPGIVLAER